jgi:hypothetical protein
MVKLYIILSIWLACFIPFLGFYISNMFTPDIQSQFIIIKMMSIGLTIIVLIGE